MKRRSLWYAFMLTWLSAANTASLPEYLEPAKISVTGQSSKDTIGSFIDSKDSDTSGEIVLSEKRD